MTEETTAPSEPVIPPIDFTTFVLSMSTACMTHLAEIDRPDSGRSEPNLPMARQTIEILEMLEAKTRGNLTGEEERILEQVLEELREGYDRAASS